MKTTDFFAEFLIKVMETPHWKVMESVVENSPWHREANVAVHTLMTIEAYMNKFSAHRTERERMLALMALLFHDFGKPEAEEVLEKKDEPGVMYRRYAGHEPVSANEFLSFMCDQAELREMFFAQGYGWNDVRTIKFMIEHHLPYGLKNPTKRNNLRQAVGLTMGDDEESYWDMLRSDAAGRISDDHETKLKNVEDWIAEFRHLPYKQIDAGARMFSKKRAPPFEIVNGVADYSKETGERLLRERQRTLFVLCGVSGAGKSTWIKNQGEMSRTTVVSEDAYRMEYAGLLMEKTYEVQTAAEKYDAAWKFCHLNPGSKYDAYAKMRYQQALDSSDDIILDRMNQGRKGRSPWIEAAKQRGYKVVSIEFYVSEETAKSRQKTRGDKELPAFRVHQIYMQQETPWLGPEVDGFKIIAP
jgi:predicted kinase